TASARPAAAVDAYRDGEGLRMVSNARASAAGTSSCRDDVAGSESTVYAPPCPGAKQASPTWAAAAAPAAQVCLNSAHPASYITTTASAARTEGRCTTTRSGSTP